MIKLPDVYLYATRFDSAIMQAKGDVAEVSSLAPEWLQEFDDFIVEFAI